nr:hypothetical protein [Tanacetum cinerariifolium]
MINYGLYQRTTGYDKMQKNDLWLLSMFEARHQNKYANVAWLIARWMEMKGAGSQKESMICCGQFITTNAKRKNLLSKEVLNSLSAPIYYIALDTTTLRELIDSKGRLIPKIPEPGVLKVTIPRAPRASMKDLYERMVAWRYAMEKLRGWIISSHIIGIDIMVCLSIWLRFTMFHCRELTTHLVMISSSTHSIISNTHLSSRSNSQMMMSSVEMTRAGCVTACFRLRKRRKACGEMTRIVPATDNSPAIPERTTIETILNMSPENNAHFESEKELMKCGKLLKGYNKVNPSTFKMSRQTYFRSLENSPLTMEKQWSHITQEAYDGEVNLEFEENLISNEYAVKLCLDYEVKKGKELEPDPFEDDSEKTGKSSDDWDQLLNFNFDDVPKFEEAKKKALAVRINQKFALLEEERLVIETMAYNDKYKKILDEIWKDKVELDGNTVKEEEDAVKRIKGEALKEKDDPGAFIFPIRLQEHTTEKPDYHDLNAQDNTKQWKRCCFHTFTTSSYYEKDVAEMLSIEIDDMLRIRLHEAGLDEEIFTSSKKIIRFRLDGRAHNLTLLEFARRLRLYQVTELEEEGFNVYFKGGSRSDEHFNAQEYWLSISREEHLGLSRSHTSTIRNLILRVIHKMITYGLCQMAWVIAKWMKRKGAGTQKESQICYGQFISKLARKCRVLTEDVVRSLSAPVTCRDLDTTMLRDLIDSDGKLIPEEPQLGVPRVGIPRPPIASMQELYDRMGRIDVTPGNLWIFK